MYAVSVPWATVRAPSSYLALTSQITTRDGFCYAATSSLNASWVRGSRNASKPVVVKYSFTSARVHSPLYLTLGVHRPAACARRLRLQSDERGLRALRAHAQFIATKSGRGSGNRTCRIFGGLGNHVERFGLLVHKGVEPLAKALDVVPRDKRPTGNHLAHNICGGLGRIINTENCD